MLTWIVYFCVSTCMCSTRSRREKVSVSLSLQQKRYWINHEIMMLIHISAGKNLWKRKICTKSNSSHDVRGSEKAIFVTHHSQIEKRAKQTKKASEKLWKKVCNTYLKMICDCSESFGISINVWLKSICMILFQCVCIFLFSLFYMFTQFSAPVLFLVSFSSFLLNVIMCIYIVFIAKRDFFTQFIYFIIQSETTKNSFRV